MRKAAFVMLSIIFLPLLATAQEIGKAAPAFEVVDSNGETHALDSYKGKYVVLEWINPDCPFVKKHYNSGNMQSLQKKYTDKGVVWLTVNSSAPGKQGHLTADDANSEKEKQKAHMTAVLLDHDGKIGKAYGAKVTPHMYIIDPQGTLIYAGGIDDNNSADIEDIKTAKNYVSTALDEALSGAPVTVASSDPYGCGIKYAS